MQPSRTEQLNGIVSALDEYINLVRAYQMEETAVLLDMAKAWTNIALVEEDVVKQARKAFSEPKAKRPLHF